MSNIESNLKKLLKGEKACIPEHFLKVPSYNSPTLRIGKGKPLSEGAFGKMYRGSINDNGRRYVAYKEIDTSESTDGAFEFEFKVAEKLKEFAVPEMYLFKKCPIQYKTPKKVRKKNGTLVDLGAFPKRTKPKDILYMELLDGMSFNSWWKTNPSLDAIKSVITQVFDNLYRINQKFPDFRHRDLHGGNVMVSRREAEYTWKVDLGRKVIRNDLGGSFRSRLGSPDIKKYKRTNAGVEAHIIDFGLSYWSRRMPNPETADGGYEGAGIYGHGIGPGTIYYDIHRFLYIIYVKVRQPENAKERAIKNFIEELIPNKEFLEFNGKFTSQGYLLSDYHVALRANLPTFKTILTHPFLTGEKSPNRPKTLAEALKMIAPKPKPKTPVKVKTPKAKTKTPSPKLSTTERKKKRNSAIKRAAAILAKPKAKPAPRRRPGVVRPNPVPEIQPASPSPKADAPYEVMSPSNMLEYAAKIESGRKKAANKLNARVKEIKATKGKTPTPVRLKEKFSFVNVKGKKREFVRKFAYDRALAKNKAERAKTPTPEEAGKEWNKRYKETFGITFKEIPNYVMPPAAHNRHMGMINNRREYVNDRIKGKTPSFGYIATTAERAKAKAKAKTPTPKAKKNEYWRSFVDVNGKKQEFESKSAYHEAKQKNLQAYAAKFQKKINRQIQLGRDARFSFVDVNGKKREYMRKGMYEKALAKNKAERSLRGDPGKERHTGW
jgi:serine/threonine protein kinase